jgi:hypothetical protein
MLKLLRFPKERPFFGLSRLDPGVIPNGMTFSNFRPRPEAVPLQARGGKYGSGACPSRRVRDAVRRHIV